MLAGIKAVRATIALLASFALLSCSSVEFEQTTERGSLMEYDEARIPDSYRGMWASPKDACFVTRNYGRQIEIGERSIGEMPVRRLWFYSDYPDIVVELDAPESESDALVTVFLQLSLDEQKLRMRQSGERETRVFHLCKMK